MVETRFYLPLRRNGEIVVFSNLTGRDGRLEWVAVARSLDDGQSFTTLGRLNLSAQDIQTCITVNARISDLVGGKASLMDLDVLARLTGSTEDLLLICAYLNLLRSYLVGTRQVQVYLDARPQDQFSPAAGIAMNKLLIDRHQPELAQDVLDQDMPIAVRATGDAAELAEYFRTAARLYELLAQTGQAALALTRSITLRPSATKWRKLAEYHFASSEPEQAIDAFLAAALLEPLPVPAAFRLGKLLFEAGRYEQAAPHLQMASEHFQAPCARMLDQIAAKVEAEPSA